MFGRFLEKQLLSDMPEAGWRATVEVTQIWRSTEGSLCSPSSKAARPVFLLVSGRGGGRGAASTVSEESFPKLH